jgi:pimeloyl-ACP methyl ester carboxylesterase
MERPSGEDAGKPIDVRLDPPERRGAVTLAELTYAGATDDRVTATLVRPAAPAVAGTVMAHGGSDDGRRFFVDEAVELAGAGIAVLLPATRLPAHGDEAVTAAAIGRAVANFRRGLDVLGEHAEVGRLCFFGHSAGGGLGALLAAVEPRLDAVVLAGTGSGTSARVAEGDLRAAGHPDVDSYLAFLDRFDPRHHVGRFTGRLLVQYGRRDGVVTAEDARRMYAAAGPAARWAEYDDGHGLVHPDARRDRREFLLSG